MGHVQSNPDDSLVAPSFTKYQNTVPGIGIASRIVKTSIYLTIGEKPS